MLAVAEIEIDASFLRAQFFLERYRSSYRLDISQKKGVLLVYIKATIPSRQRSLRKCHFRIQTLPFELYLKKKIWLVISIYRPSLDSLSQFLESLTGITYNV